MSFSLDLNLALRQFVKNHGIPLSKLSIKLGVAPEECLRWWSDEKKQFPISKILQLARVLGVSEDDIILDRIHSSVVDVGIIGFKKEIAPKYSHNAFSYVKSSKHIVEFITLRYGTLVAKSILYKLGVNPAYFDNMSNRISICFYEDILKEYLALGNSYEDLQSLSKCRFLTVEEDAGLNRIFSKSHSYTKAFQSIHESVAAYEENFDYEFHIRDNSVRIITKPTAELAEAMKNDHYGSKELYQYRSAVFGHMVILSGLPPIKQKTLKCVSQGDQASIYELEYPSHTLLSSH